MNGIVRTTTVLRPMAAALCLAAAACDRAPQTVTLAPPEVSVSRPVERKVGEFFETTGQTVAVESVEIRARVSGYLTQVHFEEGSEVEQGDVLFEIDARPFQAVLQQAEAELAGAEAQLKRANADVARTRSLLPKGAASERELESGVAAVETARAQIQTANAHIDQAKLDLEWSRVTAPISGRVGRAVVTVGNLIQLSGASSSVLTTIVTTNPMHVYLDADEASMLRQQEIFRSRGSDPRPDKIKDLGVPVWISLATESGFPHQGVIDFMDNQVDPSTGTIKIRGLFTNDDRMLTPGLFVRVRVPFGAAQDAVLVSERAVGTDQGTKYLLVVGEENVVEYRPVTLGAMTDDGLRVIREGLSAGERVIVNGIQRARPGITVAPHDVAMIVPARAEQEQVRGERAAPQG